MCLIFIIVVLMIIKHTKNRTTYCNIEMSTILYFLFDVVVKCDLFFFL